MKILDWISIDEDERITADYIEAAAREAADRIEELEAENYRLREALKSIAKIHWRFSPIIPDWVRIARKALATKDQEV